VVLTIGLQVGVLLLNLGGPDTLDDVQPFLYNLFADPDIIRYVQAQSFSQESSCGASAHCLDHIIVLPLHAPAHIDDCSRLLQQCLSSESLSF